MRRVLSALLIGAGLATALSFASPVRADSSKKQAPSTIVVVTPPDDRFGLRLIAELQTIGLRVVAIDPAAEVASRASLESAARDADAIAAIRAVPSSGGVEVWIADRVTGKTVLRQVVKQDDDANGDAALRVVELLRASLLEVSLPGRPRTEKESTPELRDTLDVPELAPREPSAPTLRASLGAGAIASPGGFAPVGAFEFRLDWLPFEHVGLDAFVALPITDAHLTVDLGKLDFTPIVAGGALRFLFTTRANAWGPSADMGVAAISLRTHGVPDEVGSQAERASALAAAPFVRLGVAYRFSPYAGLRADLLASVMVQNVSVRLQSREVATFGKPLVMPTLGFDFGWF